MHQQAVPNISPAPPIFPAPPTGHKAQNMPAAQVGEGPTGCKYFKEIILSEKSVLPISVTKTRHPPGRYSWWSSQGIVRFGT